MLLRLLQLAVRLIEALIGAAQFAQRQAHHHAAGITPLMVEPRGAVHREGGGRSARIPQANLAIGNSAIHAQLCQHLLDVPSAAGVENRGERLAGQLRFASARDLFEREVNALDAPRPAADRQHVRHGREHARNQRLSFLKRRVFALKLDLVLDKLGVNGIHLLDDLDPGVLACLAERDGLSDARAGEKALLLASGAGAWLHHRCYPTNSHGCAMNWRFRPSPCPSPHGRGNALTRACRGAPLSHGERAGVRGRTLVRYAGRPQMAVRNHGRNHHIPEAYFFAGFTGSPSIFSSP